MSKIPNEFSIHTHKNHKKFGKCIGPIGRAIKSIYTSWKYILTLKQTVKYRLVTKSSSYNNPIYQQLLVLNDLPISAF